MGLPSTFDHQLVDEQPVSRGIPGRKLQKLEDLGELERVTTTHYILLIIFLRRLSLRGLRRDPGALLRAEDQFREGSECASSTRAAMAPRDADVEDDDKNPLPLDEDDIALLKTYVRCFEP